MNAKKSDRQPEVRSQRPRKTTVFAAAFLAGAAAAVGVNRTLDVHLAQRQPRVESEPIFVALRSLPQGAPITVWDVALRDWPKAMLPAAAMRPRDSLEGMVAKHPLREGQPILSVQLVKAVAGTGERLVESTPTTTQPSPESAPPQTDLWAPAEAVVPTQPPAETVSQSEPVQSEPAQSDTVSSMPVSPETVPSALPVPSIADPIVVAEPSNTDIDSVPVATTGSADRLTSLPPPSTQVARYLVVPERIALEADRSFLPPPPAQTPIFSLGSTAQADQATVQQPEPATADKGQATRPVEHSSSGRTRNAQRPPRSATTQRAQPQQPEKTSLLRSMMPSLSLGMGAAEPTGKSKAAAEKTNSQPTRSPVRGFGFFR